MKPVLPGDVISAARALRAVPPHRRAWLARRIVAEARAAAGYVAANGRSHPRYGTGTLMTAALKRAVRPEPMWDDPDFAQCLITVLEAVVDSVKTPPQPGPARARPFAEHRPRR